MPKKMTVVASPMTVLVNAEVLRLRMIVVFAMELMDMWLVLVMTVQGLLMVLLY